eukprot:2940177-Prymnesium_polylepis.1
MQPQVQVYQRPRGGGGGGGGIAVGMRVDADYSGIGYFHSATVNCVYPDGTYELVYDDGLMEDHVPLERIRTPEQRTPPQAREPPAASSRLSDAHRSGE